MIKVLKKVKKKIYQKYWKHTNVAKKKVEKNSKLKEIDQSYKCFEKYSKLKKSSALKVIIKKKVFIDITPNKCIYIKKNWLKIWKYWKWKKFFQQVILIQKWKKSFKNVEKYTIF